MIYFGIRNLKVYFKDKASVFFSLLSVFIIIGLYVLFLGDVMVSSMPDISGVRFLMDSWIMAGMLAAATVTTTMGAFGIMVQDKEKKLVKDFAASPVRKSRLMGGYILGALVIGLVMSLLSLLLAELYIFSGGGALLPPVTALKTLGLLVLNTLCSSSIVLFLISFMKSSNAFATASTIIGTLIGFLTGIYLPIGQLPEAVQLVVKIFPVSHGAVLLRQVMMEAPLAASFSGLPPEALAGFEEAMGVRFFFGDTAFSSLGSILILVATALVFYGLSILNLSRKAK